MIIYLMIFSALALAFICKKDKLMYFILFGLMIIIMGLNTYNADFDNYYRLYNYVDSIQVALNSNVTYVEPGVSLIIYFLKTLLGLSYNGCLLAICAISLSIISIVIFRYGNAHTMILALFFIAPYFPCDIIQVRNFMAESIIIFAVMELFSKSEYTSKDYIKYVAWIMLASAFHTASFFYLLILLICIIKDQKSFNMIILCGAVLASILPTILLFLPFIPSYKISSYLSEAVITGNARDFILIAVMILQIFLSWYMMIKLQKTSEIDDLPYKVYKVHLLMIVSIVMIIFFSSVFYRLPRNLLILDYFILDRYWKARIKNRYLLLVIYIGCSLLWSMVNVLSEWNVILQNNSLFSIFW